MAAHNRHSTTLIEENYIDNPTLRNVTNYPPRRTHAQGKTFLVLKKLQKLGDSGELFEKIRQVFPSRVIRVQVTPLHQDLSEG